ncbi:hypothetical protein L9Z41_06100 [Leptospira noguchii]|uniref:hypothetical protein n=1 Tax=Leptospira noguchii TaxID=28182 RepID=UPI001F06A9F9|nr:hypothetical protein [Leptospira noguchii]MCH1913499.1 hypothetical protein [Leptospira noguchii]MCH1915220.1 hypothetical protein [Leptospira noguchii]UOG65091.1 hypothetical protein MAL04_06440 [Leptospira noguchii]
MAEDYEMVKDDNSHEEGRNVGMDELQFDDIDSILSSEPENLSINLDPLESLVASSGEEYPSSFESDFVFHSEETTGSANFNIEDTLDLELTDPLVDAEIDKLLDINDISNISEISNLESDDSFFIPGDSAPDDGIDFSELDNSLTEEPDAFSFGEEDLEEFELSDQNEKSYQEEDFLSDEEGPIALSETELGEIAPAAEDDLPDFISTSVDPETEDEDSTLGEITGERSETSLDELEEEDAPISLSGNELDNILNTSSGVSDDDLPDFITHIEDENFSLPVEQDSNLLSLDEISNSSLFEDSEEEKISLPVEQDSNLLSLDEISNSSLFEDSEEEKISLPEHELEGIGSPVLSEEDSLSFEDFELPTNDLEELENSTLEEDEDANEPIALSDEELGNLLASENEEPAAMSEEPSDLSEAVDWDSPTSEPSEISLEDEDTNEPIALSDEELGNLLASENEEPAAMSEEPSDLSEAVDWDSPISESSEISLEEDEDANEPIALSDEELGNLLASENEEPAAMSEESSDLSEAVDWDSPISEPSEISLEDEDANEPIALSDEELGNLLASENEEPAGMSEPSDLPEAVDWDSPTSESSEISLEEDEDTNEPIALSDEELGNLLASENEEPAAMSEESSDLLEAVDWDSPTSEPSEISLEDEDANEPIALSDEELGNLLASENEEPAAMSDEPSDLPEAVDWDSPTSESSEISLEEDEDANEPIALSLDELDHILTDENEEPAAMSEESSDLPEAVDWDSPTSESSEISLEEDEDANEPIALSLDELDHILTDENEEPAGMSEEPSDLPEAVDLDSPISESSEISLEDEDTNEPIALSLDELDHILTDENEEPAAMSEDEFGSNISEVEAEEDLSEILGELPPVSDLDAFDSIDEDVSKEEEVSKIVPTLESVKDQEMVIVLDEYADEEESSPIEELRKTPDQTEAITGQLSGDVPSKDEMKRIMTYLDELLGNLPDDLIREFSRSDYFELYKKLMKQIGV